MGRAHSYIRGDLGQRFWPKVKKSEGCWEWQASLDTAGYGNFGVRQVSGKYLMQRAHRVAWELVRGAPLTSDQYLCHRCDNPRCVNPDHLFVGDAKANAQDCVSKGRLGPRGGEDNPRAKLTETEVAEIRKSALPLSALAARFGVGKSTVHAARKRVSWGHLP